MYIAKKEYCILAIIFLVIVAVMASAFGQINPKYAFCEGAPSVEGTWLDDFDSNNFRDYDLAFQDYNIGRSGTARESAFIIKTPYDLAFISYLTRNNRGSETLKFYELGNDIDLAGKNWVPMGTSNSNEYSFMGIIDGKDFAIKNLTILDASGSYQGLIAYARSNSNHSTIKQNEFRNLTFDNVYIQGSGTYYAAIASQVYGGLIIDDVTINGYIETMNTGSSYVAGFVSRLMPLDSTVNISNVVNNASINNTGSYAAGIIAHIELSATVGDTQPYKENQNITISNAVNNGTVYAQNHLAGIVSYANYVKLIDSYNTGNIEGNIVAADYCAGLIGRAYYGIDIENCYNEGIVEGRNVAGLVGYIDGGSNLLDDASIIDSYNIGQLIATNNVGGLITNVSINYSTTQDNFKLIIENCYNAGELSSGSYMSGIIALLRGSAILDGVYNKSDLANDASGCSAGLVAYHYYGNLEILNSYNLGDITAVLNNYVAGLVAYMTYGSTTNTGHVSVENSYNLGNLEGSNVGGLLGYIRGSFQIEKSFNIGEIVGSNNYAGGLVAYAELFINQIYYIDSSLSKCYNTGSVMGAGYNGGLIGYLTFNISNDGADAENHRTRKIEINECINAGEAYQSTNRAGGIISRINYTTKENRTQIVQFIKTFSANDQDEIVLTSGGEFDPENNLNLFGSANAVDSGPEGRLIIIDKEEGEDGSDISRILSKQELQAQETYANVGYDFGETGEWLMPNENGTGNNGVPYLKTFGIAVTLNVGGNEEIYRATYKEALNIIEYEPGKTFTGWSTSLSPQDNDYEFYPIGTPVILNNFDITLYANFEITKYYRLEIEPVGVGSLAYTYSAIYEKDGLENGFTIGSIYDNYFELTVTGEGEFVGWQVWKQIDANAGKWVPLVGKSKTLSLLDYPIDQEFIDEYVTLFAEPETDMSGTHWAFGELKIRAAKKTTDIAVSASANDASLGKIKISDRDISYSGQITLQDGIEVILEGLPVNHYKTTEFRVTYSYKDGEGNQVSPELYCPDLVATNNIAMLNLDFVNLSGFPQNATDIEINIEVIFAKVEYAVELIVQLKDGSNPNNLPEIDGDLSEPLLLNEKADISVLAPSIKDLEDGSRYRFISWKMYNHITNKLEEFNYGMNDDKYVFENLNVIDESFLNKYINGEKIVLIAEYSIDYMVNVSSGDGGLLDINVVKADGSAPISYNEIEDIYFEKGTVINITAKPNTYYLFAGFNGSECGVINESDEKNLNIVLNSPVNVTASFNEDIYEIVLKTVDINNEDALTGANIELLINGSEADRAKLGDTISVENIFAPESYRFENFIFKNGENEKTVNEQQTVDANFLATYRTINNQIILIAYYVKQYELNVIIPNEQRNMGSFKIKIYDSESGEYEELANPSINNFDIGTKLKVEVFENEHFSFMPFKTLSSSEKDLSNPNIANITLKNDRALLVEFADIVYDINFTPEIKGGGEMDISADSFKVGDEVVVMFTPVSGQVVKSWTINNVSIEELRKSDFAVVRDNSITLTITENWFSEYGYNLTSIVETQLNGTIFTAIILISIIVPGLLALLIVFSVLNNKKRKVIKAELQSMQLSRYKMDTSSFMKDLREGKDAGHVSDEDIKAEMKRRKKSKK